MLEWFTRKLAVVDDIEIACGGGYAALPLRGGTTLKRQRLN